MIMMAMIFLDECRIAFQLLPGIKLDGFEVLDF
jgi:hypothetical protein